MLIGNFGVGKSSLMGYRPAHHTTLGVDFKKKDKKGKYQEEDVQIEFQIWDTASQEKFQTVLRSYYCNAEIVFLCFYPMNKESFEFIQEKQEEITTYACSAPQFVLIETKSDLLFPNVERIVSEADAKTFAKEHEMPFYQTSAKNGQGIDYILDELINNKSWNKLISEKIKRAEQLEEPQATFDSSFLLNTIAVIAALGGTGLAIAAIVTALTAAAFMLPVGLAIGATALTVVAVGTFFYNRYQNNKDDENLSIDSPFI